MPQQPQPQLAAFPQQQHQQHQHQYRMISRREPFGLSARLKRLEEVRHTLWLTLRAQELSALQTAHAADRAAQVTHITCA